MSEQNNTTVRQSGSALGTRTMDNGLGALTYGELWQFATQLAETQFVPDTFRGKPADVMAAVLYGHELGVKPLTALQGIAIINGRPAVWGDLMMAIVQAHPAYEWHKEQWDEATLTAHFWIKRQGNPEVHHTQWSQTDTNRAGFGGKQTYKSFPQRMHRHRARQHACQNMFADALKGLAAAELAEDFIVDVTPIDEIKETPVAVVEQTAVVAALPAHDAPMPTVTDAVLEQLQETETKRKR